MRKLVLAVVATSLVFAGTTSASALIRKPNLDRLQNLVLKAAEGVDPWEVYARSGPPVPEDAVGIGPGSRLRIGIPGDGTYGCTANFIWRDSSNNLYLGSAGHCFLPGSATATHGPGANFNASGVVVDVLQRDTLPTATGTWVRLGSVAFARQSGQGDNAGNDFGLVRIPLEHHHLIRTAMPVWGGPRSTGGTGAFAVYYGQGLAYGETAATRSRVGAFFSSNARTYAVAGPAIYGDSGSAVNLGSVSADVDVLRGGSALGLITHLAIVPPGGFVGPTVTRAAELATQAGLSVTPVLAP